MFVYILRGSGDAVWIGEACDLKMLVARLESGRGIPKLLQGHHPVGLAAVVGPFCSQFGPWHLKTVLQRLEPERLRAFLAGVPDEVSLLARLFPDSSLHFWTGDPLRPRDWVLKDPAAEITAVDRARYIQRLAPACDLRTSSAPTGLRRVVLRHFSAFGTPTGGTSRRPGNRSRVCGNTLQRPRWPGWATWPLLKRSRNWRACCRTPGEVEAPIVPGRRRGSRSTRAGMAGMSHLALRGYDPSHGAGGPMRRLGAPTRPAAA